MWAQLALAVGALVLVAGLIWAFARQAREAGRLEKERDDARDDANEAEDRQAHTDPVPLGDEQSDAWRRLRDGPPED